MNSQSQMTKSVEQARRELFEAWAANNAHSSQKENRKKGKPIAFDGFFAEVFEKLRENDYRDCRELRDQWLLWNAALDAAVIELPKSMPAPKDYWGAVEDCRTAIESTGLGLKTK